MDTSFKSYGISGQTSDLISSFLSKRQFRVFLDRKLMLEFLKVPSLVLHFSYYTIMAFLMMLSVILLSMLILLLLKMWLGIWSVATTRIGFWTWIWSTRLWTGAGSGLLILMLKKLNSFCLASLITLALLIWKWMHLFLRKNHLLRCWD